tara:strand:- start:14826 stop:15443 length:618 start_codon:yes stop_codon:yes gene_type:complete
MIKPIPPIVILAAGNSSRLGQPKQFLKWGNTTLLEHTVNQALHSESTDIWVVTGAYHSEMTDLLADYPVQILHNSDWKNGLGSSIATATKELALLHSSILFLLADQPEVTTAYINRMITEFRTGENNIVATQYPNSIGIPVVFDKTYFSELAINSGNGAKQVLLSHAKQVSVIEPAQAFQDIDTKEDYEKLYLEYWGESAPLFKR